MEVIYLDPSIKKFIESLENQAYAKTMRTIKLLFEFGNLLTMPYSKHLESNLYELRIRGKQEARLFYTFFQNKAVIVHGFVKKTQKTPLKELETARKRISLLTTV